MATKKKAVKKAPAKKIARKAAVKKAVSKSKPAAKKILSPPAVTREVAMQALRFSDSSELWDILLPEGVCVDKYDESGKGIRITLRSSKKQVEIGQKFLVIKDIKDKDPAPKWIDFKLTHPKGSTKPAKQNTLQKPVDIKGEPSCLE